MTRKLIKFPILGLMLTMVAMLFMGANVFADEIDTPEDEIITEEDVYYNNSIFQYGYYNDTNVFNYYTIGTSYNSNHYDEFYLYSEDPIENQEFLDDNGYTCLTITFAIQVEACQAYKGYVSLLNYHTTNLQYAYAEGIFDVYSTRYYVYTFKVNPNSIGNSLCFKYKAYQNYFHLKGIKGKIQYSYDTQDYASLSYVGSYTYDPIY
jgi:hypothetical protein